MPPPEVVPVHTDDARRRKTSRGAPPRASASRNRSAPGTDSRRGTFLRRPDRISRTGGRADGRSPGDRKAPSNSSRTAARGRTPCRRYCASCRACLKIVLPVRGFPVHARAFPSARCRDSPGIPRGTPRVCRRRPPGEALRAPRAAGVQNTPRPRFSRRTPYPRTASRNPGQAPRPPRGSGISPRRARGSAGRSPSGTYARAPRQ